MKNNRLIRLMISIAITAVLMTVLVLAANASPDNRILIMLGGHMPEGLIQATTLFLFVFGLAEAIALNQKISYENDAFSAHLLPEKENWVLDVDEVNQLKLNMQHLEQTHKFLLIDLIKKAATKYRLSKSSAEALAVVEAQTQIYRQQMESEQSFINYVAWAIPSVGFIGTVIGIAASLGYASNAATAEGIKRVTDALSVAFDTTLVALFLSIILMLVIHTVQKRQDELFTRMNSYMIENLINRFYR